MANPAVLMTDPRYFTIRGGANPHTRNPDSTLKSVDSGRAWKQWHNYVDALLDGGVDIYVAEAVPELTGMVFAANAGFLAGRLEERPSHEKTFYPSHFTAEHRRPEGPEYAEFMENLGFEVADYPDDWRFEGEADAFPVGRGGDLEWIFTYGFRSDPTIADWLEDDIVGEPFHRYELADPKYYHGDCILCDLGGPLLGWSSGLVDASAERLREDFGDRLVELEDEEGAGFAGNSFYVETDRDRLLYTPTELGGETHEKIEAAGVTVVPVDISEFFGKGGGGPKCMVFNLGRMAIDEEGLSPEARSFRRRRHVERLREQDYFPG